MFIMVFPVSYASDYLINSGKMSVIHVRKLMNSLGYFGPAVGLTWLAFVPCDITMAVVALCFAVGCYAGAYNGYGVGVRLC